MKIVERKPGFGYLDRHLWIPKDFVQGEGVKSALTFAFPDPYAKGKVRCVYLWRETEHHLLVPRNFWKLDGNLPFPVIDCRPQEYKKTGVTSKVTLDHRQVTVNGAETIEPTGKDVQRKSMDALMRNPSGLLQLACGKGKTIIALDFIARMNVPAIIALDNTQLLHQWGEQISMFLDVPGGVGLVQADVFDWQKNVVLTTYHTLGKLAQEGAPEEFCRHFGLAIWDEGHHVSAPSFAASAEMFYGYRLALTATPNRTDGLHVIYDMHVGGVLHKDLTQDLVARTAFRWSGLELDRTRPDCDVIDSSGEIHLSKLARYYGCWKEHLHMVISDLQAAVAAGRKVLVLCNAEDEAINLCAMWNGLTDLYTDVAVPSPQDVGETLTPVPLDTDQRKGRTKAIEQAKLKLTWNIEQVMRDKLERDVAKWELELRQADVHDKVAKEHRKRQRAYLAALEPRMTKAGLMIYKVDAAKRQKDLKSMQVMFATAKYGREGLDEKALDTIFCTMPFSSPNLLQQIKGRVERMKAGKKSPLLVVYEHNIGPVIGLCMKIRKLLREWPQEEGGPFDYEMHGHPKAKPCSTPLFG